MRGISLWGMNMKHSLLLLASLLALVSPQLVHAGSTASLVAPFSAAAMEFPESIAVDSAGNVYLSMVATGVIKKVTPAGVQSVFATINDAGGIFGLKFDPAGNLLVAGSMGVWKVTPGGAASLFSVIPGQGINDLVLDAAGNIFVTDDTAQAIWKVDAKGKAQIWSASPLLTDLASFFPALIGPNGIVFDAAFKTLYVSLTSAGRIIAIPVNADGTAGTARVFVDSAALVGADGLVRDDQGNLIVAINLLNRIAVVSPDGRISDLATGGLLNFPTGVALDSRNGQSNLYVCNDGNFFFGATQSNQGLLRVTNPAASRTIEVSSLAQVGTGSNILVGGFVISGPSSKTVLVRAIGPSLGAFGVANALADPQVAIYGTASATAPIASNDNWGGDAAVAAAATASGAFALSGSASKDAALLVTLAPGAYTARVSGVGGASGIALLEIYEVP